MTTPLPKSLAEKRDELVNEIYPPMHPAYSGPEHEAWLDGFDACYDLMQSRERVLVEALRKLARVSPRVTHAKINKFAAEQIAKLATLAGSGDDETRGDEG